MKVLYLLASLAAYAPLNLEGDIPVDLGVTSIPPGGKIYVGIRMKELRTPRAYPLLLEVLLPSPDVGLPSILLQITH